MSETIFEPPHANFLILCSFHRMKALLFTLVRAFEFELGVAPEKVSKKSTVIVRPVIIGEDGNQMPLIIRPVVRS